MLATLQAEELLICDFLLKIFRICVPRMSKTSIKFAQDLQQALQPMILKPTLSGGISVRQMRHPISKH
jgi:cohesin loading factor subunit SCC2